MGTTREHPAVRNLVWAAIMAAIWAPAWAVPLDRDYADLSLEELMKVEVTSVARKSQQLADVAAAVYVINQDDIRRSGARSLPEALRLAPGVDAAHISGDRWAVSIRGFNGQFANKLLVMVDGRSVYSPAFSGVFWEALNYPLSEVERIEVVRGPGASVWGANAVNGVINVITKSASASQGGQINARLGSGEYWSGTARYGASLNSDTDYRVYLTSHGQGPSTALSGNDAADKVNSARAGFRMDRHGAGEWTWIAEVYHDSSGDTGTYPSFKAGPPAYSYVQPVDNRHDGVDLVGKGAYELDGGGEFHFQGNLSANDNQITGLGRDRRYILDTDAQHHLALHGAHDLIWGLGLKVTGDTIDGGVLDNGEATTVIKPTHDTLTILSLYGQDEIRLVDDLRLTLGARLEHHSYTGLEFQPNVRLLWHLSPEQSAWTSLARAIRTPSRGERSFTFTQTFVPSPPLPVTTAITSIGGAGVKSEVLNALEIGHRAQWAPSLSTETVFYLHHYDHLLSDKQGTVDPNKPLSPEGYATLPILLGNDQTLTVEGMELTVDWRVRPDWRLQASYSYTNPIHANDASTTWFKGAMPRNIASLRSGHNLGHKLDLDLMLRHVDARTDSQSLYPRDVAAYTAMDVRLGWRPQKALEVSLMGRDLMTGKHLEFINDVTNIQPTQVGPSLELRAKWDF